MTDAKNDWWWIFSFSHVPTFPSFFCFCKYDRLHRTTGDERSPLLPTIFVVCTFDFFFSFFSALGDGHLNTRILTPTYIHTYIQTLGTEQYRDDLEVFCAGWHAFPSERSHRQYTAEVGWFVGLLLKALQCLSRQSVFEDWTVDSHNALQEQQQGGTLTWEDSKTTDSLGDWLQARTPPW